MVIKLKTTKEELSIDLTGPEGNVFYLMGTARKLAKQLGKDPEDIVNRMKSSDYENAVNVFEEEFGNIITLYR